jgi:hypothetical protein
VDERLGLNREPFFHLGCNYKQTCEITYLLLIKPIELNNAELNIYEGRIEYAYNKI